jgi:hypothetical protein
MQGTGAGIGAGTGTGTGTGTKEESKVSDATQKPDAQLKNQTNVDAYLAQGRVEERELVPELEQALELKRRQKLAAQLKNQANVDTYLVQERERNRNGHWNRHWY